MKDKNEGIGFGWVIAGLILVPMAIGVSISDFFGPDEPDIAQRWRNFANGIEIGSNIIGVGMLLIGLAGYLSGLKSYIKNEIRREGYARAFTIFLSAIFICYSPLFMMSIDFISVAHQIIAFILLLIVAIGFNLSQEIDMEEDR